MPEMRNSQYYEKLLRYFKRKVTVIIDIKPARNLSKHGSPGQKHEREKYCSKINKTYDEI